MKRIAVLLALVAWTAAVSVGSFVLGRAESRTSDGAPGAVRHACQTFMAALSRADAEAAAENDRAIAEDLAHPFSAPDVWSAEDQDHLVAAAGRAAKAARNDRQWEPVASALEWAARGMNPDNLAENGRVGRHDALETARAACIGR